ARPCRRQRRWMGTAPGIAGAASRRGGGRRPRTRRCGRLGDDGRPAARDPLAHPRRPRPGLDGAGHDRGPRTVVVGPLPLRHDRRRRRSGRLLSDHRALGRDRAGGHLPDRRPAPPALSTWRWSEAGITSRDEAVDIALDPGDGGTVITLRHTGPWADDQPVEDGSRAWQATLAALGSALLP